MVSLSALFVFIVAIASTAVYAQNVIQIDVPQVNSKVTSRDTLNITYTIIGSQAANPTFNVATTYPSSLSIDFIWAEQTNPSNVLSLNVASGLDTDSYPGGLQNVQHIDQWKLPNCHFFSRYPPTSYDFSLLFTPNYAFSETAPVVGTAQSAISVPLSITVDNSTFPKC